MKLKISDKTKLEKFRRQRLIEWWSVLNAKQRPSDIPSNLDSNEVFNYLTRSISKKERLDFWSGEFSCGTNIGKFIKP